MVTRRRIVLLFLILLTPVAGCTVVGDGGRYALPELASDGASPVYPPSTAANLAAGGTPAVNDAASIQQAGTSTQTPSPTPTITPTPTATEVVFEVGNEITIQYLQDLEITGSQITFEEELDATFYFRRHLVSYISEGNKIYGLLTIPTAEPPEPGYKAIVFNHGYIPPTAYRTTERYNAYVDYLARSGFVVFKIDYRGHGESEGEPSGSYFSPGYTIDSIAAFKSLQTLDIIDPQGIGMWGHSMAGNLTLRAMLIEPDIKAGVIWAGAVYSYDDFTEYGIDDNTYRPPATEESSDRRRRWREIFDAHGRPDTGTEYWKAVSLTENIEFLQSPLQLHHAQDDPVVDIGYSEGLAAALQANGKEYEFYLYEGGGHNLASPYFGQAMQRTVAFFRQHL
jgi:dipeptidyl aminopeptidase/acylaminoacyl peptidase